MPDQSQALEGLGLMGSILGTFINVGAQQRSNEAAQQVYATNKAIAYGAAQQAISKGNFDAARVQERGSQIVGQQQAAFGASGVVANAGSPVAVAGGTKFNTDVDAQTIRNNAAREAWGYTQQASNIAKEAQFAQQTAEGNEAGTILGGIGKALPSLAAFAGML